MDEAPAHLDLFSGIGGFALAALWGGYRTVCFCESDPRCQAFLRSAWPGVPQCTDIKFCGRDSARWWDHRTIGLLTAGVPCQPASRAGKQGGAGDDRWLWPEAIRVLGEVRPAWALFENPLGILDVGIDGILADVEGHGYETQPIIIPACAVGSPQRRDRVWIICRRSGVGQADTNEEGRQRPDPKPGADGLRPEHRESDVAGSPGGRREPGTGGSGRVHEGRARQEAGERDESGGMGDAEVSTGRTGLGQKEAGGPGRRRPCDAGVGNGPWSNHVWLPCADGKLRRAPDDSFGLVDGLHRSVLAALGNSIVPQVAYEIIKAIRGCVT